MSKVKVEMTLDIDFDAWVEAFGIDRKEVREDVRAYIQTEVYEGLRERGYLTDSVRYEAADPDPVDRQIVRPVP